MSGLAFDVDQMNSPTSAKLDAVRRQIMTLAPTAYPDHASQYPNTFRIAVRLINNIDGHGFKYVLTVGRWGEGRQELAYGAEISTVGFFEDECQKLAMRSLRDEVVIQAKKEGVDVMGIA